MDLLRIMIRLRKGEWWRKAWVLLQWRTVFSLRLSSDQFCLVAVHGIAFCFGSPPNVHGCSAVTDFSNLNSLGIEVSSLLSYRYKSELLPLPNVE